MSTARVVPARNRVNPAAFAPFEVEIDLGNTSGPSISLTVEAAERIREVVGDEEVGKQGAFEVEIGDRRLVGCAVVRHAGKGEWLLYNSER